MSADSDDEDTEFKNKSLNQKLLNLERDWDSFNHHQLQKLPSNCDSSLDDDDDETLMLNCFHTTPARIMSSLQLNIKSPSNESWKVRTNDFAIQEALRERKAAIASGKLKGRRLNFSDFEIEAATTTTTVSSSPDINNRDEEICNDCLDLIEQQFESQSVVVVSEGEVPNYNNGIKSVDSAAASSDIAADIHHQSNSSTSCLDSDSASSSSSDDDSDHQQQKVLYHHQDDENHKQETKKKVNYVRKSLKSCGRKVMFCMKVFMLIGVFGLLAVSMIWKSNFVHDTEVFLVPT